jgi:hypothetical protein
VQVLKRQEMFTNSRLELIGDCLPPIAHLGSVQFQP